LYDDGGGGGNFTEATIDNRTLAPYTLLHIRLRIVPTDHIESCKIIQGKREKRKKGGEKKRRKKKIEENDVTASSCCAQYSQKSKIIT